MTLDEQIQRFDRLTDYLENELPGFAEQVAANDLAALVTNRVVQKGENYKGGKFKPYSRKTIPAFRFWGKSRTQAAEKKVRAKARAHTVLSYADFRELNNLSGTVKNFNFTGEMWRKLGVVAVKSRPGKVVVSVGGTTSVAQDKIDQNSDCEDINIIEANNSERVLVGKAFQNWLDKQANRILN